MHWTLITGASNNLGAHLALTLAKQKHNILVHYNTSHENAETVAINCRAFGVEAKTVYGNFSHRDGVKAFIQKLNNEFPHIKVLINNVGSYLKKSVLETSIEEWEMIFQENLFVSIALAQALAPSITEQKGNILNIGACGLSLKANTFNTAYAAAKTALLIFTKSLAKELAPLQTPINMISPGQIEQSIVKISNIPMEREATFEEIANVAIFLLQDSNRYITGQNIEVAGGLLL
ncbi:MAG: SDR family oxidoreductase [Rhabdochlamydiaceae bacterium]|nr:SDR family oxidoreductase [Rhabdochlamydiaceae bacterium]